MYRARFNVNYNASRSPWFADKASAKDWAARSRTEVVNGHVATGSDITVNEFFKLWLEKHVFSNLTTGAALREQGNVRRYILPKLAKFKVRSLTFQQIDFLISDLKREKRLAPKSINLVVGTIKKALNGAAGWRFIIRA